MYKLKIGLAAIALMLVSQSVNAQSTEPEVKEKPSIPGSILRVGYSPINHIQSGSFKPGITIEFEKPLTPRLTVAVNYYRDFTASNRYNFDQTKYSGSTLSQLKLRDIRSSLSVNVNYYFKPYAYEGFYAAYRVNNAFTEYMEYDNAIFDPEAGNRRFESEPWRGLYLGYRKTFDSGFFVDGSAGVAWADSNLGTRRLSRFNGNLKLTLGWQLGLGKKKKKKKK